MAAVLRFAPWQSKAQLTPASYKSLTAVIPKVLYKKISEKLDIPSARTFVAGYVQDTASHSLRNLGTNPPETQSSDEIAIRNLNLQLAKLLAEHADGLDISMLIDLAIVYGETNPESLWDIFAEAFLNNPTFPKIFEDEVIPVLTARLAEAQSQPVSTSRRTTHTISQLAKCGYTTVNSFAKNTQLVKSIAQCYQVAANNFLNGAQAEKDAQNTWLRLKADIIDIFHAIIETLTQSQQPQDHELFFDVLFTLTELPSTSSPGKESKVPFVSQSLLGDYQYAYDLSGLLQSRFASLDDPRVDLLVATLSDASITTNGIKAAKGLTPLVQNRSVKQTPISSDKGKGKARAETPAVEIDSGLDMAVSQVLDIFPTHKPRHIRRCLQHPTFNGNAEQLISAMLEGNLPFELNEEEEDTVQEVIPQEEELKYTKDRRNIWDNAPMEFSQLRIGKSHELDTVLDDNSFIAQMKADIIRRAEELSDDEYETIEAPAKIVPFEEELEEDVDNSYVKVRGPDEESDSDRDELQMIEPTSPETILEIAYLADPKQFDRDVATRRSKGRADLKSQTGWSDEQIEGWRIMLERNPKKDKILSKHEFSGNKPAPPINDNEPGPSGGDGRGRVRGGRGRGGRGERGGGGGGVSARDRAWKDKNKARQANHNRKRGHDKKMARVAPPAG